MTRFKRIINQNSLMFGNQRLRLVWLIDSLTIGGAERLVVDFGRLVNKDLIDFRVVCLKVIGGNPIAGELDSIGVPVSVLQTKNLRDLRALIRLVRLIKKYEVDIIHTHLTYADIWGRFAGLITRRPVVSTVHVPTYFNYSNPRPLRDSWIESIATFTRKHLGQTVVAVSDALRKHHVARGFPSKKIITIHNGIEISKFTPPKHFEKTQKKSELGVPNGVPVIITLSVLREGKGHNSLLRAAELVLSKHPQVRFLIVGGGPLEEKLRKTVKDRGLSENIIFTGMRKDTSEILATADLFVLPSLLDPLPTVVLEAMAMRLPIVAFDSGGVPEMVLDGHNGLLVPPSDPKNLANAISDLLSNTDKATTMGESARTRVELEFSAQRWVESLQNLYFQLLTN